MGILASKFVMCYCYEMGETELRTRATVCCIDRKFEDKFAIAVGQLIKTHLTLVDQWTLCIAEALFQRTVNSTIVTILGTIGSL